MAFEIKNIDPVLFAEIFTPTVMKELNRRIHIPRNWIADIDRRRWAIDEEKRACVIWVHMADRMNSQQSYSLVWNDQVMLISQLQYCRYDIVYASAGLQEGMADAKDLMREALRVGGEHLDGTTDPNDSSAIPHAEFVEK